MRAAPVNDYALFLDLTGRRVLVVGAGAVATRRVARLLEAGARVEVVAPSASAEIAQLAQADALGWAVRTFVEADVAGAWLVHAATGDPAVDGAVVAAAEEAGIWAVRASDAAASPAWSATTTNRDGVTVAVNGGRDPGRAVAVRQGIASALASGDLPMRERRRSPRAGRITLIGAGPGDPDLLTLRGRRLLRQADVVVTDHLVPAALLADLEPDVEVHYAGKRPGHHSLTQEQINALIVQRARAGQHVVRLKGGDPFLLGRGGEEALACVRANIPVEVVPGITSALSVPAAAGIPVTHRGITASVLVLSGHDGPAGLARQVADAPADATLVLLMGTRTLPAVTEALVRAGRPERTPAAIIERGWTQQQRTVTGTLADIADLARVTGVGSPAIVVIGDVVRLRPMLGDLARPSPEAGHALPEHVRGALAANPVPVP
jgi:uroporphyrin-III C-methyltransferase/precorrin-2 dehydrogenase/sirohydrochlorin ferrochelatase